LNGKLTYPFINEPKIGHRYKGESYGLMVLLLFGLRSEYFWFKLLCKKKSLWT